MVVPVVPRWARCGGAVRGSESWRRALLAGPPAARAAPISQVSASVGSTPTGQAMAPGFVGLSFEYKALHVYTGRDPTAVDPVLVHLLRRLAPGPVAGAADRRRQRRLRPGGRCAAMLRPRAGSGTSLTPGWLRTTKALAAAARRPDDHGPQPGQRPARGGDAPRPARSCRGSAAGTSQASSRQRARPVPRPRLVPRPATARRTTPAAATTRCARCSSGSSPRWRAALPNLPLAGPAFAELTWLGATGPVPGRRAPAAAGHRPPLSAARLAHRPDLAVLSLDRQPAERLLLQRTGLATVAPYVAMAHAAGHPFRVDEMNSAAGSGKWGISNTFASRCGCSTRCSTSPASASTGSTSTPCPAPPTSCSRSPSPGALERVRPPRVLRDADVRPGLPAGRPAAAGQRPRGPVKVWASRSTGRAHRRSC